MPGSLATAGRAKLICGELKFPPFASIRQETRGSKGIMTKQHDWANWSQLRVGSPTEQYAFWQTLAQRQGWTIAFAENVFEEYRKFLYLALTSTHPIAPPPPIRAAWDLHRELPSWRELAEANEIEQRLSQPASPEGTRAAYLAAFSAYPPESIWAARPRPVESRSWRQRLLPSGSLAALSAALAEFLPNRNDSTSEQDRSRHH